MHNEQQCTSYSILSDNRVIRLRVTFVAIAIAMVANIHPSYANSKPSGEWRADCDAWGVEATCTSIWRAGLHESHTTQDYKITNRNTGAQIFAGRGVYMIVGGEMIGAWEDSGGEIHRLSGSWEDGELVVYWGEAGEKLGRSIYKFEDDTMRAQDSLLGAEGWREFMKIDYQLAE